MRTGNMFYEHLMYAKNDYELAKKKLNDYMATVKVYEKVLMQDATQAFYNACNNGDLEMAKWAYTVFPKMNNYMRLDLVFTPSCLYGHLHVAKWLLETKPDINVNACIGNYTFGRICNDKQLVDVSLWLQSLKPWYYKIDFKYSYDEDGNEVLIMEGRVRTEEEQKRYVERSYALWVASPNSPNKQNILYKLPSEIVREIVMMI